MTKPFTQFNYDDAADLLGPRLDTQHVTFPLPINQRRPPTAIAATDFYQGNHWQNGRGFIGQLPPLSLPGSALMTADIKAGFVSENVVQEVVETHVGGILGREPSWSFMRAEDKTGTRDVATGEVLTPWWNKRKVLSSLQQMLTTLLCEGTVVQRLFFPRGRIPSSGRLSASTLGDALDFIYFQTFTADKGGVFTDPETQRDIGIFLFEEFDAKGELIGQAAELSFLNERNQTICKIVRDNNRDSTTYDPYELGGHLLIYQLDRRALITEQVQSNQRAINLAHTMMMRNVNLAGNRERTITNAQPPVPATDKSTITSTGNSVAGRFPGTFKTGAGAVNFVMGWPIRDEAGIIVGYTNPNVSISDPVSVETFVATSDHYREAIYSQVHQRHVLIVDKADTSGRAREIAQREYERSLKESKTVVDAGGRWLLEATVRLAAQVSSQINKFAPLRADFNTLISAGDPDPEKQKTALLLRQPAGPFNRPLISEETAQVMIGIEDTAAENTKIEKELKTIKPVPAPAAPVAGQQTKQPDTQPTTEAVN